MTTGQISTRCDYSVTDLLIIYADISRGNFSFFVFIMSMKHTTINFPKVVEPSSQAAKKLFIVLAV